MYTPAVTIVAAWIRALTGVGPAMASGSQTNRGIWADFPVAPRNSASVIAEHAPGSPTAKAAAWAKTLVEAEGTERREDQEHPMRKPKSPIRFTMNAFFAASPVVPFSNFRSYQNPISR